MPGRGSNNRKPFKTSSMGAAPSQYAEEVDGNQEEMCPICLSRFKKKKTLDKCKHSFCEDCISRALQVKKACPMCGCLYGQLTGNQPDGKMEIFRDPSLHLPGYEKYGTIVIRYTFPAGIQGIAEKKLLQLHQSQKSKEVKVSSWNSSWGQFFSTL